MKLIQILVCLAIAGLLIGLNQAVVPQDAAIVGGLSWAGWASILAVGCLIGFFVIANDSARAFGFFRQRDELAKPPANIRVLDSTELRELGLDKYRGPAYPHPVIFPERCIGCQACVDACPHDVLAIVDGTAAAVAPDLCMEDTACQAECPVNPKACIVINTAKDVRSLPTPVRDGASYQTNVPGCFIIGDVSGVPLIKNAVKEGAEVISSIIDGLKSSPPESKAQYDVAIIGVGPGGASAAAAAQEHGLKYIAIEQDKTLSTIDLYPKGKYIFFKPDTKDWFGGIPVTGLGLAKAKYATDTVSPDDQNIFDVLAGEVSAMVAEQGPFLREQLLSKIPVSLHADLLPLLSDKIEKELKIRFARQLRSTGTGDWPQLFRANIAPQSTAIYSAFSAEIVEQLQARIPGDQRENILGLWLSSLAERGVKINENESCKSVDRADDGDYFTVRTEAGAEKEPRSYTARRVVVSIGLRGAPNKLRLPNEDLKIKIDGREEPKVIYGLSNPQDLWGLRIVVVGGGNVAVEAAVDLVATRDGATIKPRPPETMNQVTLLVRDHLAPTVKFGNKFQLYQCADDGIIDLRFGIGIKEMRENELVLEDVKSKTVIQAIPNDLVFALIGGERPNRFLESIGINIK